MKRKRKRSEEHRFGLRAVVLARLCVWRDWGGRGGVAGRRAALRCQAPAPVELRPLEAVHPRFAVARRRGPGRGVARGTGSRRASAADSQRAGSKVSQSEGGHRLSEMGGQAMSSVCVLGRGRPATASRRRPAAMSAPAKRPGGGQEGEALGARLVVEQGRQPPPCAHHAGKPMSAVRTQRQQRQAGMDLARSGLERWTANARGRGEGAPSRGGVPRHRGIGVEIGAVRGSIPALGSGLFE